MVLEGYLSRFLVERFGRYVKGLDAENLRLSAWKGEVGKPIGVGEGIGRERVGGGHPGQPMSLLLKHSKQRKKHTPRFRRVGI